MDREQKVKPDFILLGQISLSKSVESGAAVSEGRSERRLLYGEITNQTKDEEGEQLFSKALDWSYFDTNGWIKYEHVAADPEFIIGCPHDRHSTPDGGMLVKGALFNNKKYSDATWELITALEEHNREFPENQRTLGWSIEGHYTDGKGGRGGARKAKVINVVITPNPVNKSTYLQKMEENNAIFAKSIMGTIDIDTREAELLKAMEVGEPATNIPDKTGVDAIAGEEVDPKIKQTAEEIKQAEDDKKKKRKKKSAVSKSQEIEMLTFKNKAEALAHFSDQGVTDEAQAETLIKSLGIQFTDAEEVVVPVEEPVTKSMLKGLGEKIEGMIKAITPAADAAGDEPEPLPVVEGEDGDYIDAAPMLLNIEKSVTNLASAIQQKVSYDYERDQEFAKAFGEVDGIRTELGTLLKSVQAAVTVGEGENAISISKAVTILMKSRPGAPVDLAAFTAAGEGDGNGGASPEFKKNWGELQTSLEKGIQSKKITNRDRAIAENHFRTGEFDVVQTVLDKCDA